MRVMCKPGSVGDLGGQPPRSTRPGLRQEFLEKRDRSSDTGSRDAAAMARSPRRTSFDWSNATAYPDREWSTACCAAQRSHRDYPKTQFGPLEK